jgi:hypothetical protein
VRRKAPALGLWTAAILLLAAGGCREKPAEPAAAETKPAETKKETKKGDVSPAKRDAALAAARVWIAPKVPIGSADFSVNTPGPKGFDPNADVDCRFSLEPIGGMTPKFYCKLPDGDTVKVKYGERPLPNGEVPAEIAATRLLTALGFPVDRMNRVRSVRCHGCPPLPQQALQCLEKGQSATICLVGVAPDRIVTFDHALIERPLEGDKIESTKDQGWSWYELDKISPKAGGSSRAELDALRLMAMLLAHWDNKGENQRLLCPEGAQRPDGTCRAPLAVIKDLGATFGPTRVDLDNWKKAPIWADAASCRVSMKTMPFEGATFEDVQISEAGRQFTLKLLRPLTRQQLNTLFDASGVAEFRRILGSRDEPQAWTEVFLAKVKQIASAGPCPRQPS